MSEQLSMASQAVRIEECRAQAGLYALLGRVVEREVDAEFLSLVAGPLRDALREAGVEVSDAELSGADVLDDMAEDFTALFVAPGAISPYASVFEHGAMFQEPCDRVSNWYRDAGFEYRHVYSGEFPDHIGTMMAFVGVLYGAEADALEKVELGMAEDWKVRRERFVMEELANWGPGWARRAASAAEHPFYQQMLRLVERVLWEDVALLASPKQMRAISEANGREQARMAYNADYRKASGL